MLPFLKIVFIAGLLYVPIYVSMSTAATAAPSEQALVPPSVLRINSKGICDRGVAVFKVRNEAKAWKARAMVTFMTDDGAVLLQRALRMTKDQTMSYRMTHQKTASGVTLLIDYPGIPRIERRLSQPCL